MTFAAAMRVGSLEMLVAVGGFAIFALRSSPRALLAGPPQVPATLELEIVERGRSRRVEGRCPLIVGRATDADVLLMDPEVSRRHACFESEDGAVFVTDMQSSNGIYVNGQRVRESSEIRPGDQIDLGTTRIILVGSKFGTDH